MGEEEESIDQEIEELWDEETHREGKRDISGYMQAVEEGWNK
jgi:hypothetical protein